MHTYIHFQTFETAFNMQGKKFVYNKTKKEIKVVQTRKE